MKAHEDKQVLLSRFHNNYAVFMNSQVALFHLNAIEEFTSHKCVFFVVKLRLFSLEFNGMFFYVFQLNSKSSDALKWNNLNAYKLCTDWSKSKWEQQKITQIWSTILISNSWWTGSCLLLTLIWLKLNKEHTKKVT